MSSGLPTRHPPRYPPKFAGLRLTSKSTGIRQLLIGFAAARLTLSNGALTGVRLRVEAKTAVASQKLGPGESALEREPLCHGKRPPGSTCQPTFGTGPFSTLR